MDRLTRPLSMKKYFNGYLYKISFNPIRQYGGNTYMSILEGLFFGSQRPFDEVSVNSPDILREIEIASAEFPSYLNPVPPHLVHFTLPLTQPIAVHFTLV